LRRPHVLGVSRDAEAFERLAAAMVEAGLRLGWLDLRETPQAPPALAAAAELPTFRAVAAGAGRSICVKPLHGPPVLDDLLREHFLGCGLVLIAGAVPTLPGLEPEGADRWRVSSGSTVRELATADLVRALRRPHPFA